MKTNKASPCRETNPAAFVILEERESRKRFFFAFTVLAIRQSSLKLTPWKNEACLAQILFSRGRHLRSQTYKAPYLQVKWIISRYLFVTHAMIHKLKDRCLIGDYMYMYVSRNPDIRSQWFKYQPDKSLSSGLVLGKPIALSSGERFTRWVGLSNF